MIARARADARGVYWVAMHCTMGTTALIARVVNAGGPPSSTSLSVTRANQAIVWNSIALQAVRNARARFDRVAELPCQITHIHRCWPT
jgi:hypothetical protein